MIAAVELLSALVVVVLVIALFLVRGQAHLIVRLLIEAAGLVILSSKAARDVCASPPS